MTNKEFVVAFIKLYNELYNQVSNTRPGTTARVSTRRLFYKKIAEMCEDNAKLEAADYLLRMLDRGYDGLVEDLVEIFTSIIEEEQ